MILSKDKFHAVRRNPYSIRNCVRIWVVKETHRLNVLLLFSVYSIASMTTSTMYYLCRLVSKYGTWYIHHIPHYIHFTFTTTSVNLQMVVTHNSPSPILVARSCPKLCVKEERSVIRLQRTMLTERTTFLLLRGNPAVNPSGMAHKVKMMVKAGPARIWYSRPTPR